MEDQPVPASWGRGSHAVLLCRAWGLLGHRLLLQGAGQPRHGRREAQRQLQSCRGGQPCPWALLQEPESSPVVTVVND